MTTQDQGILAELAGWWRRVGVNLGPRTRTRPRLETAAAAWGLQLAAIIEETSTYTIPAGKTRAVFHLIGPGGGGGSGEKGDSSTHSSVAWLIGGPGGGGGSSGPELIVPISRRPIRWPDRPAGSKMGAAISREYEITIDTGGAGGSGGNGADATAGVNTTVEAQTTAAEAPPAGSYVLKAGVGGGLGGRGDSGGADANRDDDWVAEGICVPEIYITHEDGSGWQSASQFTSGTGGGNGAAGGVDNRQGAAGRGGQSSLGYSFGRGGAGGLGGLGGSPDTYGADGTAGQDGAVLVYY